MKPLTQQILIGLAGCITLALCFGYGLSTAINFSLSKFEDKAGNVLPGISDQTAPNSINP